MRGENLRHAVETALLARRIMQHRSSRDDPAFIEAPIGRLNTHKVIAMVKSPMAAFRIEMLDEPTMTRANVELLVRYIPRAIENELVDLPQIS